MSLWKKKNKTESTLKQDKFVEGIVSHGNASKAARDAVYSAKSARPLASRNLKRPDIQERIAHRLKDAGFDTKEVIGTLVAQMRADIGDLLDDDGNLDLAAARAAEATHIVKKLKIRTKAIPVKGGEPITETTCEVELYDSLRAATQLSRIY